MISKCSRTCCEKSPRPAHQRDQVRYLQVVYEVSERRACRVLCFRRSSHRYRGMADEQAALRMRLRDLAAARVSYGYRRLYVLLRREGWMVNHKRVYRLYHEEGLKLRTKRPRRHVSSRRREIRTTATRQDERWSMDFMSDELFDGRRIRVLTIVDHFTRESPSMAVDTSLKGHHVVSVLADLALRGRVPQTISVDNGSEFISKVLDQWAYLNGVELDFSRPGKPTDNAMIESFNARMRAECLNENWFLSLDDARDKIEGWLDHYNTERPHGSLGDLSPKEFVLALSPAS